MNGERDIRRGALGLGVDDRVEIECEIGGSSAEFDDPARCGIDRDGIARASA
jgi:hypothetical protein